MMKSTQVPPNVLQPGLTRQHNPYWPAVNISPPVPSLLDQRRSADTPFNASDFALIDVVDTYRYDPYSSDCSRKFTYRQEYPSERDARVTKLHEILMISKAGKFGELQPAQLYNADAAVEATFVVAVSKETDIRTVVAVIEGITEQGCVVNVEYLNHKPGQAPIMSVTVRLPPEKIVDLMKKNQHSVVYTPINDAVDAQGHPIYRAAALTGAATGHDSTTKTKSKDRIVVGTTVGCVPLKVAVDVRGAALSPTYDLKGQPSPVAFLPNGDPQRMMWRDGDLHMVEVAVNDAKEMVVDAEGKPIVVINEARKRHHLKKMYLNPHGVPIDLTLPPQGRWNADHQCVEFESVDGRIVQLAGRWKDGKKPKDDGTKPPDYILIQAVVDVNDRPLASYYDALGCPSHVDFRQHPTGLQPCVDATGSALDEKGNAVMYPDGTHVMVKFVDASGTATNNTTNAQGSSTKVALMVGIDSYGQQLPDSAVDSDGIPRTVHSTTTPLSILVAATSPRSKTLNDDVRPKVDALVWNVALRMPQVMTSMQRFRKAASLTAVPRPLLRATTMGDPYPFPPGCLIRTPHTHPLPCYKLQGNVGDAFVP